ncbi:MAG: choice-of-anchor K domain-containing protein [Verrucomicrobiota bacterium]
MKIRIPTSNLQKASSAGFALVEVILILLVIGLIGGMILGIVVNSRSGASTTKLSLEVKQLNAAIGIYLSSGGVIESDDTAEIVLEKLKTAAAEEGRETISGLRGRLIDERLLPVHQSVAEGEGDQLRARWNAAARRFELSTTGEAGIRAFVHSEAAIPSSTNPSYGDRQHVLTVAATSGWVWDYEEFDGRNRSAPVDLSGIELPTMPAAGSRAPLLPRVLLPPVFSKPGGDYNFHEFNLDLSLENPNDSAFSTVIYRVNGGTWMDYSPGQSLLVAPNERIDAMTVSNDLTAYLDSAVADENYVSTFTITGNTTGNFDNATGGPDLDTGGEDNLFEWGTPYVYGGFQDPSWVLFNGASFYDVNPDERFEIGTITYYNGTIYSGTGADSVDLNVELAFGGGGESREFEFTLDLINVANDENAHSGGSLAWASADYVYLDDVQSTVSQSLGGEEYELILEFGETTSDGLSTIDSFYVLEEGLATGTLYGTLVRVEPIL